MTGTLDVSQFRGWVKEALDKAAADPSGCASPHLANPDLMLGEAARLAAQPRASSPKAEAVARAIDGYAAQAAFDTAEAAGQRACWRTAARL